MEATKYTFCGSSYWVSDGILFFELGEDLIIDEKLAREMVETRKKIFGPVSRPICIDAGKLLSVNRPALLYLASAEGWEYIPAAAIFTNHKLIQLISNAWFKLNKPPGPARVFVRKEEALEWLKQFRSVTTGSDPLEL